MQPSGRPAGASADPEHGGEVDAAAERFGIARDRWLDLSTGINPNPYPLPDLAREYWHRLPDAALDAWLRDSAAAYYGVPDAARVVPAAGSQAIIQCLPRLIAPTRVAVVSPTYREHGICWAAAGHSVIEIDTAHDVPKDAGVLVLANPNNPDGRTVTPERLLMLGGGRLVVVDEAFADVAPDFSLAGCVGRPDLVVLRSFGKFFGLAGMRLGFALLGEPLAMRLRSMLGPWAVGGPAAAVGAVALADSAWARAARVRLTAASSRLDGLLMRYGLQVIGGTSLFRLVEHPRARALFEMLAQAAILVRPFRERPDWLRFGIPGDDAAFERLAQALADGRSRAAGAGPVAAPGRPGTLTSGNGTTGAAGRGRS